MIANLVLDWTKSKAKVVSRLSAIRKKLKDCTPTTWPRPNIMSTPDSPNVDLLVPIAEGHPGL